MLECGKCDQSKPEAMFSRDASRETGYSRYCKACVNLHYRNRKPEGWVRKTADIRAYNREREKRLRAEQPEAVAAKARRKYEAKMRRLHGPDWQPRQVMTADERAAALLAKYRRNNAKRAAQRRVNNDERIAHNARKMLNKHVVAGKIVPWPCEVCGDPKTEGHHIHYGSPLLVVGLCKPHHLQLHHEHRKQVA